MSVGRFYLISWILPPTVGGLFWLYFTTALISTIVQETNAYARQVLGNGAGGKWTDVTADVIWAFLRYALLMGINCLPQFHQQPAFHYLPIAEQITRDHFMAICRYIRTSTSPPIHYHHYTAGKSPSTAEGTSPSSEVWFQGLGASRQPQCVHV